MALHSLGEDLAPHPAHSSTASNDASTREDESPEAAERRRRAIHEILERGRVMEERRKARAAQAGRSMSFDDMVDQEGKLKEKDGLHEAVSTAAEPIAANEGLRKRHAEAAGVACGTATADPFGDETGVDFADEKAALERLSNEERAATPGPFVIDNDVASTHPSEMLIDLTPTTSNAHSSFPPAASDVSQPDPDPARQPPSTDFQSVHEWAETSTASFYSPPESEHGRGVGASSATTSTTASIIGSTEHMSEADMLSDIEGVSTPGTWTEVGSVVSDEN